MDKKTEDSWYWTTWFSFSLAYAPSIIRDTKGEIKIWDVYCFTLVLGFCHFITKIKIVCLISQTQNGGVAVQFVSSILLWGMLNVTQKSPPIMNSVTTQPPTFVVPKASKDLGKNVATNCPSYPVEESQSRKKTGTLSAEPRRKNHPRKQGSEKYPSVLQLPLLGATTGTRNHFHWYSHLTWKDSSIQWLWETWCSRQESPWQLMACRYVFQSATMAWDVYLMVVSKTLAS